MAYDASSYAAAIEPWRINLRGTWFPARLWSAEQARKLADGWTQLTTEEERRELWRGVLDRLFPFRVSYLWYGDPRKMFWDLPVTQQNAAIRDFFEYLARQYALSTARTGGTRTSSQRLATSEVIDVAHLFPSPAPARTAKRTIPGSTSAPAGTQTMVTSPSIFSGGTGE